MSVDSIKCPKCNAPKGKPCVYLTDKVLWVSGTKRGDLGFALTYYLKGEPTKNFHYERHERYNLNQYRLRRRQEDAYLAKLEARRSAILKAYYDFDIQEHKQLKEWLRQYGDTLWRQR